MGMPRFDAVTGRHTRCFTLTPAPEEREEERREWQRWSRAGSTDSVHTDVQVGTAYEVAAQDRSCPAGGR